MTKPSKNAVAAYLRSNLSMYIDADQQHINEINLFTSGVMGSFDLMNFIISLEEKFCITVPAEYFDDRRFQEIGTMPDVIVELIDAQ